MLFITLAITSCERSNPKSVQEIIEVDDLTAFEKLSAIINIDTVQYDEYYSSALQYAMRQNAWDISQKLIDINYKLNSTDSLGFTPLLIASMTNNQDFINKLLKKTSNINAIDGYNGYSALHYAIYYNDLTLVKKILAKNANINLQSTDIMKNTPLHLAVEKEYVNIVDFLLENQARDTIKNVNEDTAVDLALESSNNDIRMRFYPKMSKEEREEMFEQIARSSQDTLTLEKLLQENHFSRDLINRAFVFSTSPAVSRLLLRKGAKISYRHSNFDYGAIHYAAIRGDTIMLDFLIKKGADVNQLSRESMVSPLMHAARLYENSDLKNKDIGEIQIGINTIFYDMLGNSGEKNAENSLETVKFLIRKRANTNFKNSKAENVLYIAESTLNYTVALYLKEIGVQETKRFSEKERKQKAMNRVLENY